MNKRALVTLAFAVTVSVLGMATAAETKAVRVPKEPLESCGKLPYSVKIKNGGAEIQGQLTADGAGGILGKLKQGTTGTIGVEYIAGAISGASKGAISRVITYYGCVSRNALRTAKTPPAEREAFEVRLAAIKEIFRDADAAVMSAPTGANMPAAVNALMAAEQAKAIAVMNRPLAPETERVIISAIGNIGPDKFTRLKRVQGWAKVKVKVGTVGTCGGVITGVLEQTHGDLQVVLSTTPSLYLSYFGSSPTAASNAAADAVSSYAELVGLAGKVGTGVPPMDPAFQSCTEKLFETAEPPAQAAGPAVGSTAKPPPT